MTDVLTERRVVEIPRAPSRRCWNPLGFRSFKNPDLGYWRQLIAPVDALVGEGWRVTRVVLDVGPVMPLTPGKRESTARELVRCHGDCELILHDGNPGPGRVTVELER
jgi:hypothetical protein